MKNCKEVNNEILHLKGYLEWYDNFCLFIMEEVNDIYSQLAPVSFSTALTKPFYTTEKISFLLAEK